MTNKRRFNDININYVKISMDEMEFEVDDWKVFLFELIDCGGIEKEELEEFILELKED